MDDYKVVRRIAEGRFGTVFEATRLSSGQRVAIKKVRARRPPPGWTEDPWSKSAQREIEVLGSVSHEHVVPLLDHCVTGETTTLLVYEYLAWDLAALLEQLAPLAEDQIKTLLQMLFRGLSHLHLQSVMHRDLKPANLLLDGSSGVLRIADFGSARFSPGPAADPREANRTSLEGGPAEEDRGDPGGLLTREVCTRWYKSPEMLFGAVDYTRSVDLWAAGCVVSELLSPGGKALFPGNSDLEQLCLIFQTRGTPCKDEWPEVCRLPDFCKVEFKAREPQPFEFEELRSAAAVGLACGLLQLTPQRRMPVANALEHEFFRVDPPPLEPHHLVNGLDRPTGIRGQVEPVSGSDVSPLIECDYGSDESCLGLPQADFEPVEIETTTCGLWDDGALSAAAGREDEAGAPPREPSGSRTPPPPSDGAHRFKMRG